MQAALLEARSWPYQTGNEVLGISPAWMNVSQSSGSGDAKSVVQFHHLSLILFT
jgi:hypothetical protein